MLVNVMSARQRHLAAIAGTATCLLALLAYLVSLSVPASEATRLRNALILMAGVERDFAWTPSAVPASYLREMAPASGTYRKVVLELKVDRLSGDWPKALALASHLTQNARDLGPIQRDLDTAYREIRQGRGYCADFTQVFLGLAHAAGLFAREWGFSTDGFGGSGHAFVEVFDRSHGRWLWLDVYNNVHAVDAAGEPVSALAFRDFALGTTAGLSVVRSGLGRLGYKHTDKLLDYYRRGAYEWYLWWSNAVFTYERNPLVRAAQTFGPAPAQLVAIAAGMHPRIVAIANERNAAQLAQMQALKNKLIAVMVAGILLVLLLVVLSWRYLRLRPPLVAHAQRVELQP